MPRLVSTAMLLMGCALSAGCVSLPGSADRNPKHIDAELAAAETQRFNLQIARDVEGLNRAVADELVYTHATGRVQNKLEYLNGLAQYQNIEVSNRVARAYGDAGLTTGMMTITIGEGRRLSSRYTGMYLWREGRWQLLAWQSTSVPTP